MKKCSYCGANSEDDLCWRHKPKKPLKKTRMNKHQIERKKDESTRMWELFMEIWNERPHFSEVSGDGLGPEPSTVNFDHLLEKHKYPEIKYEKWNIALVTWEEHDAKGNGQFPKHQELIDKAIARYKAIKKPLD